MYKLNVSGKVSLNEIYSGAHWTKRATLKKNWRLIFSQMLNEYDKVEINQYGLICRFNNRLDLDNNIMMVKFLNDTLKEQGWINDDSPKYFTTLKMYIDKDLPKNTAEIEIILF